jgi:UDP-2,3-diacylglucosamine pyrophosphatase LpxH
MRDAESTVKRPGGTLLETAPKKLKLILSDFHVGKGRYLPDGRRNIMEDFLDDEHLIEFLEYYKTGDFADVEIELIFNGDFFNMIQVDIEDTFTTRITEEISVRKMEMILAGHREMFDALAAFCNTPKKSIVFLAGNHDAAILWPDVQELLKRRISSQLTFYPDIYSFDGVMVTHGHRYEFINHFNPKQFWFEDVDKKRYMRLPWGSYFVIDYLNPLKMERPYIDKIKPFRIYLRWALVNDFRFFWKMLTQIAAFWFRNRFADDPVRRREFKLSISRLADAATHESQMEAVRRILKNTSYRFVIMGHSHGYDFRQFGQHGEYYNTGTWTETVSLDIQTLGRSLDRTYVYIDYNESGQPQPRLKRWFGAYKTEEDLRV